MPIPKGRFSRRNILTLGASSVLGAAALSACGTSGPRGADGKPGSGGGGATLWSLSGDPGQTIQQDAIDAFNKLGKGTVSSTYFQNDAYKTKIRVAVGAKKAPTLIFGWGGGILKSYAGAKQVLDLTSWLQDNESLKDKFVNSTWAAATFDKRTYAIPCETTQPLVLYYNKSLFSRAGAAPPTTWDDLLKLVPAFSRLGVAPIALAGQSLWTSMMWLELILDRVGGPQPFRQIFANQQNAWSNPAVIETATRAQQLVKANAFAKGYASISADTNADQALLYTGKAAMLLHLTSAYANMKSANPNFVKNELGWVPFPTLPSGDGDPSDAAGNPAQYWSISAQATTEQQDVAKSFLTDGVLADAETKAYVSTGAVPVVQSAASNLTQSEDAPFLKFVFDTTAKAKNFQQSWDQALSPAQSTELLNNIGKLFLLRMAPQEFATKMNATISASK